ncbi:class I SAM-dependent methyltransferase [Lacibacterium aquatile]|uniref:Class I SAM-dependent methyltransferase n=1 Tax=Lacibacterium aquatile TaxID=1168082 RepID=A0ABW5DV77_9PROT
MSRLNAVIARLTAQRDCLDWLATQLPDLTAPILELGLGNGRTYDHLRILFPKAPIYVFEREVGAHPSCIPPEEKLLLGDFRDTIPTAMDRIGAPAAFAHADFGDGNPERTGKLADWLSSALDPLLAPGAWIITDQKMTNPTWISIAPPKDVPAGRYFMWRKP